MTLIASDLEGTLSAGEMWRGIGEYLKLHDERAAYRRFFLGRMPGFVASKLGVIDSQAFKNDWFVRLARFFRGWREPQMRVMSEWVVDNGLWDNRRMSILDELRTHVQSGARVALVTGGFTPVVDAFVDRLRAAGIADVLAFSTPLRLDDGVYTGELAGEVCTGTVKVARLRSFAASGELAVAYGDTYADIPMLSLARQGVAVCPDKRLEAVARQRGWRIVSG